MLTNQMQALPQHHQVQRVVPFSISNVYLIVKCQSQMFMGQQPGLGSTMFA